MNSIYLKLGRTVVILKNIKRTLCLDKLHLLYCILIVPDIHYDILLWGYNYEIIGKLQKKTLILATNIMHNNKLQYGQNTLHKLFL